MSVVPHDPVPLPASAPLPSAGPSSRRQIGRAALVIIVLVYGFVIGNWFGPHAGGSDSAGYLLAARGLSRGDLNFPVREMPGLDRHTQPPDLLMPYGLTRRGSSPDLLVPTYPLGFPLQLAAIGAITGEARAPIVVGVTTAMAALLIMAGLARTCGLGWTGTWLAVAILGTSPIMIYQAQQPLSDVNALVWLGAALLAGLQARRQNHRGWAAAAGAAFALAVLVRPSNIVLAPALFWALGRSLPRWTSAIAAGLPGAVFLAWQNDALYGHPLASGYTDTSHLFSIRYVAPNLAAILRDLATTLSPWWLALGAVAGVLLPFRRRPPAFPTPGWLLLWWGPLLAFYLLYRHTGDDWTYQRFLLPGYPVLIVLPFLLLAPTADAGRTRRRLATAATLLLATSTLWWQVEVNRQKHTPSFGAGEATYPLSARWVDAEAPPGTPILAQQLSAAVFYYTDHPVVRVDWLSSEDYDRLTAAADAAGRPLYALGYFFEAERMPPQKFPADAARWTALDERRDVILWRRTPARQPSD